MESTWDRDGAFLEQIAQLHEEGRLGSSAYTAEQLAVDVEADVTAAQAGRIVQKLAEDGLCQADSSMGGPATTVVWGITPEGMREAGAWPSRTLDHAQLLRILEELADTAPDEETARGWRRVAGFLAEAGRDVSVQLIAALAAGGATRAL